MPRRRCAWCADKFKSYRTGSSLVGWTECCSKACAQYRRSDLRGLRIHAGHRTYTPEQLRAKNYRRRTVRRRYDITPEYEATLRHKAKRCPMPQCGVRLTNDIHQPTSKELDHMVPVNVGGTHTIGNVRIICRRCNQARPIDGSDYVGPVTLWAQDEYAAPRTPRRVGRPSGFDKMTAEQRRESIAMLDRLVAHV